MTLSSSKFTTSHNIHWTLTRKWKITLHIILYIIIHTFQILWASKISILLIHKTTEKYRVHLPTSDKSAPARRNQTLLLQCEWTQSPTTPHTKAVSESRTANSSIPRQISNQPAKHRIPQMYLISSTCSKQNLKQYILGQFIPPWDNQFLYIQLTVSKTTCTVCKIIWLISAGHFNIKFHKGDILTKNNRTPNGSPEYIPTESSQLLLRKCF